MIALVLFFLILAIAPGYKGFAISWKENQIGTIQDADFWYLCQSSTMSILESFTTALPLLQRYTYKRALIVFLFFFAVGFVAAVVSIIIYPGYNTGWSALISFLGSIASASSVLVLTQATVQDVNGVQRQEKVKLE